MKIKNNQKFSKAKSLAIEERKMYQVCLYSNATRKNIEVNLNLI